MHINTLIRTIGLLCILMMINVKITLGGPDNIAPLAKVTASSSLNLDCDASKVTDGLIYCSQKGEWASQSTMSRWGKIDDKPWIQLTWNSTKNINKVVIYDRPDEKTHTAGGVLQFSDGSTINVIQIPNDGSPKVVMFPTKNVTWVRFRVNDGDGLNLGLSEIEVYPSPDDYKDYVSWVDPYIETTRCRYFYFITGNQPYGMIGAAPLTRNKNQDGGGYNYNSTEVLGFPQIHCWMLSGITFMPTTGNIDPSKGEQNWKSKFSHYDEIVQPGYHRLYLKDHHIWVEQTTTDRVSFYRLTYTRDAVSKVLLNLGGYVSTSTMTDARVNKVSDTELEGSVNTTGRAWGGPDNVKIFFVMQFDLPFETLDGWADTVKSANILQLTGKPGSTPRRKDWEWGYYDAPTSGVSANYTMKAGDKLQVKFSISYTSIENARNNLNKECNHWDFDRVRKDSKAEWNHWLGRIDVNGGTESQKIKFYTDLWHTLLGRHKLDDISGDYPDYTQGKRIGSHTVKARLIVRTLPKNNKGENKYHMYNSDAFWGTQWNLNILWGMAWPGVLDDFAASLVQYADNGGLLPRGPCAGGYSFIMSGCPATNLIVSAYSRGLLTKTKPLHAFETMKRNHMPGGMMAKGMLMDTVSEKGALEFYIANGYCPGNAGKTLEWCFQDWVLAQMAKGLKKKKDEDYFLKRSEGWKNLYDDKFELIFPKDENGKWVHENPTSYQGWVEASSWQATWSVSHDINGLANLMGGKDTLCKKLNFAFEKAVPFDFVGGSYVNYSNQPACSDAHVFNYAGQPWLSQYWVRQVKEQAYGDITPDKGYGGQDEDQGQMGSLGALMSIGLFSLNGATSINPVYEITSPVFDQVTIRLDTSYYKGKEFVIKTYNNSAENCYIQKAALNGNPLNEFWFRHKDFAKGGILEIWLGAEPNKNWGVAQ